jgi:hypothetical protein
MPPFAPSALELDMIGGWFGSTIPDVHLYPNQRQAGVHTFPVPECTSVESQVFRKYQPPPPMK